MGCHHKWFPFVAHSVLAWILTLGCSHVKCIHFTEKKQCLDQLRGCTMCCQQAAAACCINSDLSWIYYCCSQRGYSNQPRTITTWLDIGRWPEWNLPREDKELVNYLRSYGKKCTTGIRMHIHYHVQGQAISSHVVEKMQKEIPENK